MELVLNLLWLAASAVLGVLLLNSRGRRGVASDDYVHSHSVAWISYLVLIAMLLPVISMTDDLRALATATDGEQIVRRIEAAAPAHPPVQLNRTAFLHVHGVWLAPVIEARPLEAVHDFYPSYLWQRQPTPGRAPPAVA